jgi:hypothetical protein
MGTLLVNERMLETYLFARDHFLKPGGKMFPVSKYNLAPTRRERSSPALTGYEYNITGMNP